MVSVVSEYGRDRIPTHEWVLQPNVFNEYQEILRKLAELDRKLGQPDCVDPKKDKWMREIEKRLKALESAS